MINPGSINWVPPCDPGDQTSRVVSPSTTTDRHRINVVTSPDVTSTSSCKAEGNEDGEEDTAALLLWSLGAWHQQQRYNKSPSRRSTLHPHHPSHQRGGQRHQGSRGVRASSSVATAAVTAFGAGHRLQISVENRSLCSSSPCGRSPDGGSRSGSRCVSPHYHAVGVGGSVIPSRSYIDSGDYDGIHSNYVSIVGQLRELLKTSAADSSDSWRSILRKSADVIANTMLATVFLGLLLALPVGMISVGFKYLNECPIQPKIPIYLLVGGCFGLLKLLSLLFNQVRTRRYERLDDVTDYVYDDDVVAPGIHSGHVTSGLASSRFTDVVLSCFLFAWFVCGQFWVFGVWAPNYRQTIQQPTAWCHKTVYVFSVIQIVICYLLITLIALLSAILIVCQRLYAGRI